MSEALPATWSIVTFTEDEAALAALAALQPRFARIRFVAVVPTPMIAPGEVSVLVDQDGSLARALGVTETRTFVVDGRGTVAHSWADVPEPEAVAVYSARPPLPSGAPAWLFPVLAAAVLIAGIAAWASTRPPAAADLASIPPAPVVAAAPAEPVEPAAEAAPADPAEDGADDAEEADASAKPGRKGKGPANLIGGWQVVPRDRAAAVASLSGAELTLKATADKQVVACREPVALTGSTHFSVDWKVSGITGKPARIMIKQLGSDKKPIRDAAARALLGRAKATKGWATLEADVKPAGGAVTGRMCLELDPGEGSVTVRNPAP